MIFAPVYQLNRKFFNQREILSQGQLHTLLFRISHDLADETSVICFLLVSSQMTVMFCTLASFMLSSDGPPSVPQICESLVIITLVPLSIIGISLCSSRINAQHQKMRKVIVRFKAKLIRQGNCDQSVFRCLNMMQEERFQVMSAAGIGTRPTS
ncbi:hypothetical protein HNY73_017205 [Argiope bruennichi]|uniref:Uncharacterized protein n=1 Tax=Argiope bruennichi TaxID=94029 RepID=A0A8T0EM49_ARGBR|nr:hypothetical protein HNY73_017205 [Argiope bruennichi]